MGCIELLGNYRQKKKMVMESAFQIRCWQVFLSWKIDVVIFHIQRIVCQPGKLLNMVASPAHGLLNREKKRQKKKSDSAPPRSEKMEYKSRDASICCLGATQVSVRVAPVQTSWVRRLGQWVSLSKIRHFRGRWQLFSSLVASIFSWRCLAASTSYFLYAAINLRPPSATVSTHTSASNVVAFQSYAISNARMLLCKRSTHSFSFPPHPLRTAPSRFPNKIRFGSLPPLIRMSAPTHKSLVVRNVASMLSHLVIWRERLYEVTRWSGLLRCASMMRSKTR